MTGQDRGHAPEVAPAELIYLRDGEVEALMREAQGPGNGRAVQCGFGPGAVWLDPDTRDEQGMYPRWIVLRLAVLRGLSLPPADITAAEREELEAFAARHGRELIA